MKKRILALTLALVMLVGLLPTAAFADDGIGTPDLPICDHKNTTTTTVDATCQAAGSTTVTCDDCGEVIRETAIEPLVHTPGECKLCKIAVRANPEADATVVDAGAIRYYGVNVRGMALRLNIANAVSAAEITVGDDGEDVVTAIELDENGNGYIDLDIKLHDIVIEAKPAAEEGQEEVITTLSFSEIPKEPLPQLGFDENHLDVPANGGLEVAYTSVDGGTYILSACEGEENADVMLISDSGSESVALPYEFTLEAGQTIEFAIYTADYKADTIDLSLLPKEFNEYITLLVGPNTVEMVPGMNYCLSFDLGAASIADASWTYSAGVSLNVNGVDVESYDIANYAKGTQIIATVAEAATVTFDITITEAQLPQLNVGENAVDVKANGEVIMAFTAPDDGTYRFATAEGETNAYLNINDWEAIIEEPGYADIVMTEGQTINVSFSTLDWAADTIDIVIEKVVACDHTVTYTDNGDGTHDATCSACNELIIDDEAHTFVEGTCVCGVVEVVGIPVDPNLVMSQLSLTLQESVCMQYIYRSGKLTGYDIKSLYIEYTQMVYNKSTGALEPQTGRLDIDPIDSTDKISVFTKGFVSWAMSESITITVYGMKDGVLYKGEPVTTSIKQAALEKFDQFTGNATNDKYCSVIVAMLNYGAAVQEKENYNVANLANADFTAAHKAYETAGAPALTGRTNTSSGTATVNIIRITMSLQDKVYLEPLLKKADMSAKEDYEVRFYKGDALLATIDGEDFEGTGPYSVSFAVPANSMSVDYTIAIYDKATQQPVSQIHTFSVLARCEELYNDEVYGAQAQALIKYGNAVNAAYGD